MNETWKRRSALVATIVFVVPLGACEPSAAKRERLRRLAATKNIALVMFIGKYEKNRQSDVPQPLVALMYDSFQKTMEHGRDTVVLIPVDQVIANEAYQLVAKVRLPDGAISAVDGMTYIRQGIEEGFDAGPLAKSLGVDALLMVLVDFGVAIRNNGSAPYLLVDVTSFLTTPPQELAWGNPRHPRRFEVPISVTMLSHPKLLTSIGAKSVVFMKPSVGECEELMRIAVEKNSALATKAGEETANALIKSIQEARKRK